MDASFPLCIPCNPHWWTLLLPASWLLEDGFSEFGAFGYFGHETLVWFVLLAFIAGILGHTGSIIASNMSRLC